MATPQDWDRLESKFTQLRRESVVDHHPNHSDPPSKIVALRAVEPGSDTLGAWLLEYCDSAEDASKIQRLKWLCCEGAALLGFRGENDEAIQHWIQYVRSLAPEAYLDEKKFSGPIAKPGKHTYFPGSGFIKDRGRAGKVIKARPVLFSEQLSDFPGLSALICRKCNAEAVMKTDRPGRKPRIRVDEERLRGCRATLKMTQEEFAEGCDVTPATIQRGEGGKGWETETYDAVASGITRMYRERGFNETVTPGDLQKPQESPTPQ